MALQSCQTGATVGFPVQLAQSLYTNWPATSNSQAQLKKLVSPTDFTIQWGPPAQSAQISVTQNTSVFQISGIATVANATTLTYGAATYTCSEILSVVQNQHSRFCEDKNALYEVILAFQIKNKSLNPSSPDLILVTRPIVFSQNQNNPFWSAVNLSVKTKKPESVTLDMSTLYGYNRDILMPMITYQACLPVKLLNYNNNVSTLGSVSVRVHVVPQPIYVNADANGLGKCSSIKKYTLITQPKRPVDMFPGASSNTRFQFMDGLGSDGFPASSSDNMVPLGSSTAISAFQDVLQKFEILVPEEFLGKSLSEIAKSKTHTKKPEKKKAFKCYRIDPEKDVRGDQILIDPTTGDSLVDTMAQKAYDDAGGDPALLNVPGADASGIMPGDIQHILTIIFITIGTIILLAYLMFIVHTLIYRENGFHDAIFHVVVFAVLLVGLTVFSVYFAADDSGSGSGSGSSMPGDPRCYYNGVKLGTPTNVPKVGNVIVYTADECKKLGGTMPIEPGTCVIANGDSQNIKQIYSYFCSTDPTILALTKK
jgi:hypothetical protein